ncbi:MAG: hypothetical protein QME40_00095 [bacterium]|nr:hypothetical protein [bacterium]
MKVTLIVILLLSIIGGLLIGGAYLLDYLGIISLTETLIPHLVKVPYLGRFFIEKEIPLEVLKEEELRKLEISLEEKGKELELKKARLKKVEEDLVKKRKELAVLEKGLYEQIKGLKKKEEAYQDREKNLRDLATYLQGMPPVASAKILEEMDDLLVIDILRRMEERNVAAVMMKMDPKKASEISRKMSR